MSFSSEVKSELSSLKLSSIDAVKAECYGLMLFGRNFSEEKISLRTESEAVADRFIYLSTELFKPLLEKRFLAPKTQSRKNLYTINFIDKSHCCDVYRSFGYIENVINLRIIQKNISGPRHISDFLRGVFLSCGSISNPDKNYHLEWRVQYKALCKDLCDLLENIKETETITPGVIKRNGRFIIYIKGSEQIADLLTFMGAFTSSMTIMGTKAMKQVRNTVNRKTNSEIANIKKTAKASANQLKIIEKLIAQNKFQTLPKELKEIARLRLDNPELSLSDLGKMIDPPISRSGVNHRLAKIIEIANNIGVNT